MTFFSGLEGNEPVYLLDEYPWAAIGEGTVVDVGGSDGVVGMAIAQRFPKLRCIIQDLPNPANEGAKKIPDELKGQVTFMAHDFFTPQPVRNADVYFFRWILHDWSDENALKILRALIPALKHDARIVIHEYVLPQPGAITLDEEKYLR